MRMRVGTYTVQLLDSNFCGIAPTSITIEIVPPPIAGLTANKDTICQGESVTFYHMMKKLLTHAHTHR